MANNNVVAKVVLIVGQAHAKAPNGTMRKLAIGDVIREGEQIVVPGAPGELGLVEGLDELIGREAPAGVPDHATGRTWLLRGGHGAVYP